MQKSVEKTQSGVKINFVGEVKKQNIVQMVQNCSTGKCDCMSDETKAKIANMEVKGQDGDVELKLEGDICVDEIKQALSNSKVV